MTSDSPTHRLTDAPDGIILIDKPAGMTSHDVVDRVRRIAHTRRVGHAGTLDPFATGLLIVGINKGTKMLTGLVGLDKTYEAVARLGATSTTDDVEGVISQLVGKSVSQSVTDSPIHDSTTLRLHDFHPPMLQDIKNALDRFRGGYLQTAPAFSAKKVGGKKLYELARAGKMEGVELPKKEVKITDLRVLSYAWPELTFAVSCSSGTYIRSLARDIGEALGCGAYLTALRRTRIGSFDVADAIPLADLNEQVISKRLIR